MSRRRSANVDIHCQKRCQKRFILNLPLTRMIHTAPVFGRVSYGFRHMSDRVAYLEGRAFPRLALTGLALLWLSGCTADVTRFDGSNPFSNPFGSQSADATPSGSAPSGHVAAAPLAPPTSVASAPLPAAASSPAPAVSAARPVGGTA